MSLIWIPGFFAFLFTISTAVLVTPGAENPSLRNSQTSDRPHSTSLSSLSMINLNVTTNNAFVIECDGGQYGRNLNIADCKDAKSYVPSGSNQAAWVERHTPFGGKHFALPYRFMGGRRQVFAVLERAFTYMRQIADDVISSSV